MWLLCPSGIRLEGGSSTNTSTNYSAGDSGLALPSFLTTRSSILPPHHSGR